MFPKISVIIPNYNNGRFLEQCISSVASQTYHDVEIVVVDDCSTDDSRAVIDRLGQCHKNVRKIYLEHNGGVSHARNVGANASTGEYLEFLDADDYFYADDKLANEMTLVQNYLAQGKKVMAYSCVACVNEEGRFIEHRGIDDQLEGHIVEAYLARYKDDRHPRNVLFDRQAFELVEGFDETMSFWEDSDLFIRLLFLRSLFCTHKLGTAYRWRNGGLSHQTMLNNEVAQVSLEKRYSRHFTFVQWMRYLWYKMRRQIRVFRLKTYPRIKHEASVLKRRILRKRGQER